MNVGNLKKSARPTTSSVWNHIKLVKGELAKFLGEKCSHICIHCKQGIKIYRNGSKGGKSGSWQTSVGLKHLRACELHLASQNPSSNVAASADKRLAKKQKTQSVLKCLGGESSGDAPVVGNFVVNRREAALGSQARYYIYGRQRVSKRNWEDPAFLDMLEEQYVAGGGNRKNFPKLSIKALLLWLEAEYEIFIRLIRRSVQDQLLYSEGNPFAQMIHDAATLKNKHKCHAIGMEFIDCYEFKNHAVCLGMTPLESGWDCVGALSIAAVTMKVIGMKPEEVFAATMSDLAVKGVAQEFGHVGEECDMHQGDKIGRSAVGDLVRSSNKIVVNPFNEGQALMDKCHKMGVHFAYSNRLSKLHTFSDQVDGGFARIKLKMDYNTTRVAARHSLLLSEIRLNKGLKMYAVANPSEKWKLTAAQWEGMAQFEGTLRISSIFTTFVQNETAFTAAMSRTFKDRMLTSLRADTLAVVDLDSVGKSPKLQRTDVPIADLTTEGRECKRRATLEAERRYCGNITEQVTGKKVLFSTRDELAVLLDPRTLVALKKCGVSTADKAKSMGSLKRLYIKFGIKALSSRKCSATKEKMAATRNRRLHSAQVNDLGLDSDSNSEHEADKSSDDEANLQSRAKEDLGIEFESCYSRYKKRFMGGRMDWKAQFPDVWRKADDAREDVDFPFDLWDSDMAPIFKTLKKEDPQKELFGYLPMMAIGSEGSIGAFLASSFCERINSAANLVVTDGNSLLSTREIDMLVTLRVNRKYMQFMRKHYRSEGENRAKLS